MGVTNTYLNELLFPFCSNYGGCFSCDNIPNVSLHENVNFIVNLSKSSEPGSHFIALIIKKAHVFYFDSFGLPCNNDHILVYMHKLSRNIVYNAIKIQADNSKMCGFYCALIVLRNDSNCKLSADLMFHSAENQLQLNDKLCIDYICRTLSKRYKSA